MIIELKVPSPGESISEVLIANWLVENGNFVEKNQELAELESDKATLPLIANEGGKISFSLPAGTSVAVGSVICSIDTNANAETATVVEKKSVVAKPTEVGEVKPAMRTMETEKNTPSHFPDVKVSPVAHKIMDENNLNVDDIINGLKRLGRKEVEMVLNVASAQTGTKEVETKAVQEKAIFSRETETTVMTSLRKKLSERLVSVKNETAMLTTFNEVDMSEIMRLRNVYQKKFTETYNVKIGFMSFFLKACAKALLQFPSINSMLDADKIISHKYADIGIAVQTPKGLMVPVIRNVESLSLAQIEEKIKEFAEKGRANRISIDDMTGGTFTITNGGTFGSLMSTPIINPPQAAILGMHNIVERPVAINNQVVIRPMMYIALSYDHRLIDGKASVSFLVKVKEMCENPLNLLFEGKNPEEVLLGI